MTYKKLLNEKLELLHKNIRETALTNKLIERFINNFVEYCSKKLTIQKEDIKDIERYVFDFINLHYNKIYCNGTIYYLHRSTYTII